MTFAIGHSGTHAGWKKPMGNATPWTCWCNDSGPDTTPTNPPTFRTNPAYLVRCNDCGERRPA